MYKIDDLKYRRSSWIKNANLPGPHKGKEVSDCSDIKPSIINEVLVWADAFKTGKIFQADGSNTYGKGLYLTGKPGQGKTTLASALLQDLIRTTPLDVIPFHTLTAAKFLTYVGLIRLQQEIMGADYESPKDSLMLGIFTRHKDPVSNIPLLVIDDLGKEFTSASGWQNTILDELIRTRYNNGYPTIITSNMQVEDLAKYNSSMASFAQEAFYTITVESTKGDLRA
jgi:hypothetical protein